MKFLQITFILIFCCLNSLFADELSDVCQEVERKVYEQVLSNQDLYQWVETLRSSLDECQRNSVIQNATTQRALDEFFQLYESYKNQPTHYHFIVLHRETHFSWVLTNLYCSYVRAVSALKGFTKDAYFETKGLKTGKLSSAAIQPFLKSLKKAKKKQFVSEDAYPERYYVPPGYGSGYESMINTGLIGYELKTEQLAALAPIIKELTPAITACTGSPWKIVNVLCWETTPSAIKWGMNNWHTDGKPVLVRKVMIYLSGADKDTGSTEFILPDGTHYTIEGPPGTWVYAKISELQHRGVPPKTKNRLVIELRILPSLEQESRPFSAGFHSFYPLVPWFNPFQ